MKKLIYLAALIAFPASVWSQEVIIGFDFAGTTTDPLAANTVANNITSTAGDGLSRVGLVASASANAFGSNGWNTTGFGEGDDYITFSLTVDPGYMLTMSSLSWTRLSASNTAPGTGRWGYSVGGGAFVLQDPFAVPFANTAGSWTISGAEDLTGSIEFRFWAYGATSVNGGTSQTAGGVTYRNSVVGDDLVLNGTVSVVPEPSTYTLLALAAAGFGGYVIRRRRR